MEAPPVEQQPFFLRKTIHLWVLTGVAGNIVFFNALLGFFVASTAWQWDDAIQYFLMAFFVIYGLVFCGLAIWMQKNKPSYAPALLFLLLSMGVAFLTYLAFFTPVFIAQ